MARQTTITDVETFIQQLINEYSTQHGLDGLWNRFSFIVDHFTIDSLRELNVPERAVEIERRLRGRQASLPPLDQVPAEDLIVLSGQIADRISRLPSPNGPLCCAMPCLSPWLRSPLPLAH